MTQKELNELSAVLPADRLEWWCAWGTHLESGDLPEAIGPQGWSNGSEFDYIESWQKACYDYCESVRRAYPSKHRPSVKLLRRIFGPHGPEHARKMLRSLSQLGATGRANRQHIVAMVRSGVGSPQRSFAEKIGAKEEAWRIADEVDAEVMRRHAGELVTAKTTGFMRETC